MTGGGVGLNRPQGANPFGIEISDTFPRDLDSDVFSIPDDGWAGGANNDGSGVTLTMTMFAICKE